MVFYQSCQFIYCTFAIENYAWKRTRPFRLGLYTLIFTIYMFGTQFAAFGIETALTKYIAEYKDDYLKINKYISSGVFGSLISRLMTGAFLYLLSSFISLNLFHSLEMMDLFKDHCYLFSFYSDTKSCSRCFERIL